MGRTEFNEKKESIKLFIESSIALMNELQPASSNQIETVHITHHIESG